MSFDLINDQIHIFIQGDSRVNPRKAIYVLFPSITCVHKLNNSLSGIETIVAKNGTLRKTDTRIVENQICPHIDIFFLLSCAEMIYIHLMAKNPAVIVLRAS